MLQFSKSNTNTNLIVTLTELSTLTEPFYYLFVFIHIETKDEIKFILATANDQSQHKYRYNKWTIDLDVLFPDAKIGDYNYTVYEQSSSSDTTTTGKEIVELGKMKMLPLNDFEYENYNTTTTYKSYNG
jgi:hypothetical protein